VGVRDRRGGLCREGGIYSSGSNTKDEMTQMPKGYLDKGDGAKMNNEVGTHVWDDM